MARKKTPCELCEGDNWFSVDGRVKGHQLAIEYYPDSNVMYFSSFADDPDGGDCDEISHEITMNFCPECGRKLNV